MHYTDSRWGGTCDRPVSRMETNRMGFTLPTKNSGGNAPEVPAGLAKARFDDLVQRHVEAFVTAKDKYDKPDDGNRLEFQFTLVDEAHEPILNPESESGEDPISLRNAKSCKPGATGEKSNFYGYLQGLLTKQELALYDTATADEPADFSKVPGRVYDVQISHSPKGWPQIETIIGIAKAPK